MGIPAASAAVGTRRPQKRRRAGRLPREEIELCHRHDELRGAAAADLGAAARRCARWSAACRCATACRRSSSRAARATTGPADVACVAHPRTADSRRRARSCVASPTAMAFELWLQPGGPATVRPFIRPRARTRLCAARFRRAHSRSIRPTSRRSTPPSIACWCAARSACSSRRRASASPISSAGSAISRLPIARRGASVVGIEGSAALVRRAQANAAANGLARTRSFATANLFEATRRQRRARSGAFDKALIDPPREGAIELVKALPAEGLARIVYVSCNPATLARDAAVLVNERGYTLARGGHRQHVSAHRARRVDRAVRRAAAARRRRDARSDKGRPKAPFARRRRLCAGVSRAARRRSSAGSGC